MKSHVEFRSSKFPAYEGEDAEINPGRWGKRLAEYLCLKLRNKGVTVGSIYSEDWGWAIPVEGKPVKMWIGCGNYEEYPDRFLCFIEPSKPIIQKLFQRIGISKDVSLILEKIDEILKEDPDINSIRWWSEDEGKN